VAAAALLATRIYHPAAGHAGEKLEDSGLVTDRDNAEKAYHVPLTQSAGIAMKTRPADRLLKV
jgi:hypothetical protein